MEMVAETGMEEDMEAIMEVEAEELLRHRRSLEEQAL